jgi:catechol 2,3-dioxygenase-like lactoylglutathione lyase family enzyme
MDQDVKLGTIGQIARRVGDIEAARRWYGKVLGLPHLYSFGKLAFFDCGGVRLFLSEEGAGEDDSILYFRVDDIHQACRALSARGVTFVDAPHMIHRHADGMEEWMAFFSDPDGKTLAVMGQIRRSARP